MTDLKAAWEKAEANAHKIQAEKDRELERVRRKYQARLQKANDKAAEAQKVFLDSEARKGLEGRDDAEDVARALGLS